MRKLLGIITQLAFVLGSVAILGSLAMASVWESPNSWDEKRESEYSEWHRLNVKTNMFVDKASKYYGIETDCADFSYAVRAIYAFENGLPFVIRDTSNLKGKGVISNAMTRWDGKHMSPMGKFREFLDYIHKMVGTEALSDDTYPVAISRSQLLPGAIFLFSGNHLPGHSYQISEINRFGIPRIIHSTTPRKVRLLTEGWQFPSHYPAESTKVALYSDGYRRFKWPSQVWKSSLTLPQADLNQFKIARQFIGQGDLDLNSPLAAINETLEKMLALEAETLQMKSARIFSNICTSLATRAEQVADSLDRQKELNGQCMDPKDFEGHSTPSRDAVVRAMYEDLKKVLDKADRQNTSFSEKELLKSIFAGPPSKQQREALKNRCPLSSFRGGPSKSDYTLEDYYRLTKWSAFFSDPNANLDQRWGLANISNTGLSCKKK